MGFLQDAITKVTTALTAANVPYAVDPGVARPKCVMVELPEFSTFAHHVRDVSVRIKVCGSPPGNAQTNAWILNTVQSILDAGVIVDSGAPGVADYGGQQMPTYEMTVRIGTNQ